MDLERELYDRLAEQMQGPIQDLSSIIADIHLRAMQLELLEPGMWWDFDAIALRLQHPNVINWMEHYGFSRISDLPPGALMKFASSLKGRLEFLERGLPHAN